MKIMTLNALHFSRNDREFAEPVDFRWLAYLFRKKRELYKDHTLPNSTTLVKEREP